MKEKTASRFFAISLILVLFLTVCTFSFLGVYMNYKSRETIRAVSRMYMSGLSQQVSMHFNTTIGLRLDQMDTLVRTVVSEDIHDDPVKQQVLVENAKAREFTYLAFYFTDGTFQMLYGSPLAVTDPEPFRTSLLNGQSKVAIGTDRENNRVILLGVPSPHQYTENHPCAALVAGLSASYLTNTLALEETGDHAYSYIIRDDGSYIIQTGDATQASYFDRVRSVYNFPSDQAREQYISQLTAAMLADEDYSAEVATNQETRQMYCTSLPHSEWNLITFMSYSALDEMVSGFTAHWTRMVLGVCLLVLALLLVMFWQYFRIQRRQMRALEQARREAIHANRAKSEFLSNMSHDIRTPMNAIVGMTTIAAANVNDPQQVQNCLRKISLSSKHLLGLINDVLDMSKIESGKLTLNTDQISLREIMDNTVNIIQPQIRAKHQHFDVSIHDISTENVCCDSVRLNQVLINLLGNAVKFTPEEGMIRVSLHEESSPRGESYVRIFLSVKDNGIGMTPEFRERIFEAFVREDSARVHKTEGSGLGMAITKYIVDAMGGTITVDSEPGKGSEFRVVLDLEKAQIPEADMVLPDWRMLVVDDEQQLCESTAASLKSIGISADWALDAESAIELAQEHQQRQEDYQIILLDWKLPGMDGITAAREIRRICGSDVPILLTSAYDWNEIEEAARGTGITGFISKPLFKSTLFYGLKPYMLPDGEEETAGLSSSSDASVDLSGRRVLLAEDNDLNWEIARELLGELGLELEWAENGSVCLDMFRTSPPGYYDAILMDLRMPVMTGYESAAAIRSLDRPDGQSIPIIAMTADAFAEDIQHCLSCGMNAHVAKPIDVREVSRTLNKYFQSETKVE